MPCLSGSFTRGLRPRDCRRWSSVRSRHHVSTFLHPLAPPALPGFIATMSALTPTRGCACGLLNLAHTPCNQPRRSLRFTCRAFRGSPSPTTSPLPRSLWHLSCQRRGLPAYRGSGLRLSIRQARQSARPNRVCLPTDCPFAFRCSPPHLAATQLRSATGRKRVLLKRTCTAPMWHARERTMAGSSPAMTKGGCADRPRRELLLPNLNSAPKDVSSPLALKHQGDSLGLQLTNHHQRGAGCCHKVCWVSSMKRSRREAV